MVKIDLTNSLMRLSVRPKEKEICQPMLLLFLCDPMKRDDLSWRGVRRNDVRADALDSTDPVLGWQQEESESERKFSKYFA